MSSCFPSLKVQITLLEASGKRQPQRTKITSIRKQHQATNTHNIPSGKFLRVEFDCGSGKRNPHHFTTAVF